MRIRFTFLWTLAVLGAALAVPASSFAGETGYKYKVVYDYCDGKTVKTKVKNIAEGSTPANKLTIESWAQKRVNGSWRTVFTWERAKYRFTANGERHWLTSWRTWHGTAGNRYRLLFRVRAWDNGTMLASVVVPSVTC